MVRVPTLRWLKGINRSFVLQRATKKSECQLSVGLKEYIVLALCAAASVRVPTLRWLKGITKQLYKQK